MVASHQRKRGHRDRMTLPLDLPRRTVSTLPAVGGLTLRYPIGSSRCLSLRWCAIEDSLDRGSGRAYCFRLSGSCADGAALTVLTGDEPEPRPLSAPYLKADVKMMLSNNHQVCGAVSPPCSQRAYLDRSTSPLCRCIRWPWRLEPAPLFGGGDSRWWGCLRPSSPP